MINEHDQLRETHDDLSLATSENQAQRPVSPVVPTVPGFTPINRGFESSVPVDTISAAVSIQDANKGKKRQRKVSASVSATPKPTTTTRPRQPKKAKLSFDPKSNDISHAFTVTKVLDHGPIIDQATGHDPSPRDTQVANGQAYKSDVPVLPIEPGVHVLLQTGQWRQSLGGLASTYQAAFRLLEQRTATGGKSGHSLSNHDNKTSQRTSPSPPFQPTFLPGSARELEPGPADDTDNGHPEVETILDETMTDPVCQVPCTPETMFSVSASGTVTTSLTHGEQYLPGPEHDDWDMFVPQTSGLASSHPTVAQSVDGVGDIDLCHHERRLIHTEDNAIDFTQFDNMLNMDVDYASISVDTSESKEKAPLYGPTNEQEFVPATPLGSLVDSDALSYSSDINLLLSRYDDSIVSLSSSQPHLGSSSPSHYSHKGLQPGADHEASPESSTPDKQVLTDEDIYNDEEVETGFLDFMTPTSAQVPPPSPPESPSENRLRKVHSMPPPPITPVTSPVKSLVVSPPGIALPKPKDIPHKVSFDQNGTAIPFIRPPFPSPIRDRSPVLGLSPRSVLRTCFRIGEALNAGSTALRTRTDAVIELYARVSHSDRPAGSVKQNFHFADLFTPDKPPFLKGTYGLWKGVEIWDQDSKVFLGESGKGKMARVVGRIGRDEKTRGLEMTVLSVWEADWEDVGICKGIYCG